MTFPTHNRLGAYEAYTQEARHWCPDTEVYTGADSLLTALQNGWQIVGRVYREDVLLRGARLTRVYHFELCYEDEIMMMPVVGNPFVTRLLINYRLNVLPYAPQHPTNEIVLPTTDPRQTRSA